MKWPLVILIAIVIGALVWMGISEQNRINKSAAYARRAKKRKSMLRKAMEERGYEKLYDQAEPHAN